jgi:uncharacterized repeat protein (TIGR04076 family)
VKKVPEYKVSCEVKRILEGGKCPNGHAVGDNFRYPDDWGRLCPAAANSIYPYIRVLEAGGILHGKDFIEACCPDPANPVVFKITRKKLR